ncbi:MAG: neutral/alkaline non-lysosomal ceramidase N-terminal domain-containing protein [Cyclobacteriaceae bacterium]|nr:neutral/alkaline non-lysosomal ceramidase N-terminal domain-containing protein [Cyclobacteriaceae bacterium]
MKRILILTGKIIAGLLVGILVFLVFAIGPVNRTPVQATDAYQQTLQTLERMAISTDSFGDSIRVGFAKQNITPPFPVTTAGYVKRKGALRTSVHDSLFVRTLVVQAGRTRAAIVSLDMLLVPPAVYERLTQQLPGIGFSIEQVFLGATHTHNSLGQWDDHLVGEVYAGDFNPAVVDLVTDAIVQSIQRAAAQPMEAAVRYQAIPFREGVSNRLLSQGPVDSLIHAVEFVWANHQKAILTSYTAHATCLSARELALSRDYPGVLVDALEANGYAFASFLAGAVGSHAPPSGPDGWERATDLGTALADTVLASPAFTAIKGEDMAVGRFALALGEQQIKITPTWRVRSWLSKPLLGESQPAISYVKIGNLVMLNMPCDFSGMLTAPLYARARSRSSYVFVTSFNGAYIGYVTPDGLYDYQTYETQVMNWYGRGNGAYLQTCATQLIEKLSD